LASLELPDGVPAKLRTMIVVPMLLTSRAAVAAHVERLKVHHLANSDGDLCFALLSDWTDTVAEIGADDDALPAKLPKESPASIGAMDRHRVATAFSCSTVAGSGTKGRESGSGGSVSGASCTNSTGCCAALAIRVLSPSAASGPLCLPVSVM
jgi:hypothetical protein